MHRMDMRSREQYLKALLGRYLRARKRGKSALLDEYCRNTGMARKSVLRKIAGLLKGQCPPRKRRRPVYGRPVRVALETLWEIFDRPCGQRLKPLVEEELGRLRALGEIEVDEKTCRHLQRVSSGYHRPPLDGEENRMDRSTTLRAGRGESHRQEDPAENDRLGPPPSRVLGDGLGPSLRGFNGRGVCPQPLRPGDRVRMVGG